MIPSRSGRTALAGPQADHRRESPPLGRNARRREKKARRTLLVFPEASLVERSGSERINGRLKDEFGGRHVRVRGYDKVLAHLMFGMTVLTASQLMRLIVPPI